MDWRGRFGGVRVFIFLVKLFRKGKLWEEGGVSRNIFIFMRMEAGCREGVGGGGGAETVREEGIREVGG